MESQDKEDRDHTTVFIGEAEQVTDTQKFLYPTGLARGSPQVNRAVSPKLHGPVILGEGGIPYRTPT